MITEADATVLEEVAEVVKHRTLILTTDATEVAEKPATVCHHSRKSDLLLEKKPKNKCRVKKWIFYLLHPTSGLSPYK